MEDEVFDCSKNHADNFRVHLWIGGKDKGRVSCPIETRAQAEAWIRDWRAAGTTFQHDDLRIVDVRQPGFIALIA